MPTLDLSTFQGQLPRSGGPGGTGGVALPMARIAPGGAGALGEFGRTLGQIGRDLTAIDQQFERAKASTLAMEATTALIREAEELAFSIQTNPDVFPSDRASAFREQIQPRFDALQAGVPTLGQPGFTRAGGSAIAKLEGALRVQGYEDSITRSKQSYGQMVINLQRELLTATSMEERSQAVGAMQALTENMVREGVFSPQEAAATFEAFRQDTAKLQLEILMETDPQAALQQLRQGLEGNPNIRATDLAPLTEKAMQRMDKQLARESANEVRNDKRMKEVQSMNASEVRIKIYDPEASQVELLQLQSQVNDLRLARDLDEADHAEFLGAIDAKLEKIKDGLEEDQDDARATDLALRIHVAGTPRELDALYQEVTRSQRDLGFSTVSRLLTQIGQQRQRTIFTNRPNYREGLRIMIGVTGAFPAGMVAVMMDRMSGETKSKMRVMMDTYRDRMETLYDQDITEGDTQAIPFARELRNAYFPLNEGAGDPELPPGFDVRTRPFSDILQDLDDLPISESTKDMYFEILESNYAAFVDSVTAGAEKVEKEVRTPAPSLFNRFFGGRETRQ